eukprot:4702067-Alexandrium_andersonii.AAC.1
MHKAFVKAAEVVGGGAVGGGSGEKGRPGFTCKTAAELWALRTIKNDDGEVSIIDAAANKHRRQANRLRFVSDSIRASKT